MSSRSFHVRSGILTPVNADFTVTLEDMFRLGLSFTHYGKHPRLIDYLAQSDAPNFKYEDCLDGLIRRVPWKDSPQVGFLPQEFRRFQAAFELISSSNRAYDLAMAEDPDCAAINEFIYLRVGFVTAYTGKKYVMNHPDMVKDYKGLLPYGGFVKLSFNALSSEQVKGTPSVRDHVMLRDMSNFLADQHGITSMAVNNWMFLTGLKMKMKATGVSSEDQPEHEG